MSLISLTGQIDVADKQRFIFDHYVFPVDILGVRYLCYQYGLDLSRNK